MRKINIGVIPAGRKMLDERRNKIADEKGNKIAGIKGAAIMLLSLLVLSGTIIPAGGYILGGEQQQYDGQQQDERQQDERQQDESEFESGAMEDTGFPPAVVNREIPSSRQQLPYHRELPSDFLNGEIPEREETSAKEIAEKSTEELTEISTEELAEKSTEELTEELAEELTAQGWIIYGTDHCPWCVRQKEEFGDAFQHIDFVNCRENSQACKDAGIKTIPCWVSPGGRHYPGYHDLSQLSAFVNDYQADELEYITSKESKQNPSGCAAPGAVPEAHGVTNCDIEEIRQMIETETGIVILDVRTSGEYESWHIEGAVLISHTEIEERLDELNEDENENRNDNKKIIVYCGGGKRSRIASGILAENGFQVFNMVDGMDAWKEAGYPVVSAPGNSLDSQMLVEDTTTTTSTRSAAARDDDIGCVAADGTVYKCGDVVTQSCTFNGDLSCPSGHGLIIGESNIVIDGDNHTLTGASPGTCDDGVPRSGILNHALVSPLVSTYDHVVIKNLEIENLCNGIYLEYPTDQGYIADNKIENCKIHHNGNNQGDDILTHGIKMVYVSESTVKNCEVYENTGTGTGCDGGGDGIFLSGPYGDNNIITKNIIYNNRKDGILIKRNAEYNEISHNEITRNGQAGINIRCKASDSNTLEYNDIKENHGDGIFVGGNENIIRYNNVTENTHGSFAGIVGSGDGIDMGRSDASCDNTVSENTVCNNEGMDIRAAEETTGNSGDENTCDSTENYNDDGTTGCTYECRAPDT
ncbi:MAG: right-handed parallel beta-helix repeat-containing protein, partial [Thermoplasmata archaeon]|nr:right-handed parallel beta-helix repeat-containing protein [Thermoplasmata archaeon]